MHRTIVAVRSLCNIFHLEEPESTGCYCRYQDARCHVDLGLCFHYLISLDHSIYLTLFLVIWVLLKNFAPREA